MTWKPTLPPTKARLSREEKRQQTRAALLHAANALFAAKGLEATTVDDIASTAGFTRGAFYANYASKIDVMKELIATGFESDVQALSLFAGARTPEEWAAAYQEYSARFERDPGSLMWVMEFQMAAMRYPEVREEYTRQYANMVARVREMARAALPTGGDPEQISAVTEAMVALQPALAIHRVLAPDRVPAESYRHVFALLLAGAAGQARTGGKETHRGGRGGGRTR
jgi:AcrR family transcriptional regulator